MSHTKAWRVASSAALVGTPRRPDVAACGPASASHAATITITTTIIIIIIITITITIYFVCKQILLLLLLLLLLRLRLRLRLRLLLDTARQPDGAARQSTGRLGRAGSWADSEPEV